MKHEELYKLLVTVQKNVHCPQCGKSYGFPKISIRGIVDTIVFLELNCTDHMPLLATVTLSKSNTKPTANDKIDSDDVIEMYRFLKKFNGSFEKLFEEKLDQK